MFHARAVGILADDNCRYGGSAGVAGESGIVWRVWSITDRSTAASHAPISSDRGAQRRVVRDLRPSGCTRDQCVWADIQLRVSGRDYLQRYAVRSAGVAAEDDWLL